MTKIKTAIIDLYNNEENQGMRCIQDILRQTKLSHDNIDFKFDIFDARYRNEIPTSSYDIFISSGGPGSPFEGEGSDWERRYFTLMDSIVSNNESIGKSKKHVFFICHSFQIMARYFGFAEVNKRNSYSFGIYPVHKTQDGESEILFETLSNPFYAADFREYQVIEPNQKVIDELNIKITALEKERPHVEFERAIMSARISDEIVGTQFHPEADAESMYYHFRKPERKEQVVNKYGEEKYINMISLLEDPETIVKTQNAVLPTFLANAIDSLRPELKTI